MRPTAFVDTSAFYALADRKDRNHQGARRQLRIFLKEGRPLITSTYVLDELFTLARMRLGHAVAVKVGEDLSKSRWCEVFEVSEETRNSSSATTIRRSHSPTAPPSRSSRRSRSR